MKISHPKTNEVVRKVLLCKWLNLKPDEVENLSLEEWTLYSEVVVKLEGKSVL